ncbi:MAG: hypothetical protein HYV97_14110 [Bdellovibrio sp.]|nr:hypothetical protein [Bdellovibrio sp.]
MNKLEEDFYDHYIQKLHHMKQTKDIKTLLELLMAIREAMQSTFILAKSELKK